MRPRHHSSPDRRRPSPSRRSRMSSSHMSQMSPPDHPALGGPTPICRCRVLYLGSAVPHVTKDGLQGIQEPLKELYPEDGAMGAKGIDSWLSVWSNGFLLENVDENRKKVTRFFPVEALHYCAAVRFVLIPSPKNPEEKIRRFLPLDSPFARLPNINHPPLFAAILRRTTGIKVLECHVFICKRETAANALVRCAFHAYADSTYAKHLESSGQSIYGTIGGNNTPLVPAMASTPNQNGNNGNNNLREYQQSVLEVSDDSINSIDKVEEWTVLANGNGNGVHHNNNNNKRFANGAPSPMENGTSPDEISVANGPPDDNHKVWQPKFPSPTSPENLYGDIGGAGSTLRSFRSSVSGLSHRNRPRQMMMPVSPPPPPIPEELTKEDKKKKKRRSKSRDEVDMNGDGSRGHSRKQSVSSLRNGHGPPRGGTLLSKAGTFSARSKHGPPPPFMMYGPPPPYGPVPPHLMPPPGHPLYGMMPPFPPRGSMEEPIYMPHNARPLSPVASYQPGHFPHEAYYNNQPQQYATIDKANKYRKNKKTSKNSSKQPSSDSNNDDSEFGAGIYKKGHINERAFSYSIRNEQRSRSFGSLSNMQFTPNGEAVQQNGDVPHEKMMHMMSELDMGEEQLERSEVPPGMYHPGGHYGGPPPPHMMYGHPPPHMMMMPPENMMRMQNGGPKKKR